MSCKVVQEMEKKNSQRLTAVEKNQVETQRMLGDVMKTNLGIQSMLQSFISSFPNADGRETAKLPQTGSTNPDESTFKVLNPPTTVVGNSSGIGSSERWWDRLCRTSDEEEEDVSLKHRTLKENHLLKKVSTAFCFLGD